MFWGIGTGFSKTRTVGTEQSLSPGTAVKTIREAGGSSLAKVAAHAAAGGTLNTLQGGKFGHGFLSAGVTEALSPAIGAASSGGGAGGVVAGTVASAVVGGTVSELSGGKFGNGAQTGAFQYLFNKVVHKSAAARSNRKSGVVYLTAHPVGGIGPDHLSIEFTDRDGKTNWISAGPEAGRLVSGVGENQRPTDHPSLNFTAGVVTPPAGLSAAQFFSRLLRLDAIYCDCVDYDLFPEISDSYNSNSFVFGLVQAGGGTPRMRYDWLPHRLETGFSPMIKPSNFAGGPRPLPSTYFGRSK